MMMDTVIVTFENGKKREYVKGIKFRDIIEDIDEQLNFDVIAGMYNNQMISYDDAIIKSGNLVLYDINTNIDFGKYKHLEIKYIINSNPNYLIWAIQNIIKFRLTDKAINLLCEKIEVSEEIIQINNKK